MNGTSRRRAPQKQKRGSAVLPVVALLAGVVLIFSAAVWKQSSDLLGGLESRLSDTRSQVENAPALIERLEREIAVLEAQKTSLEEKLAQDQSAAAAATGRKEQLERLIKARQDILEQYR